MAALGAVPLLDRLLRQAGRADLVQLTLGTVWPALAMVSGATVGAVLASRRPRHPVGWLLLALSLTVTAAAAQYLTWGLLVRPGALPAARSVARYSPAIGFTALTLSGFLLLLTPTGSLPSPGWHWWARAMAAVPVVLVLVATLMGGPLDPRYQALGGPFDFRGFGRVLLLAHEVAVALTFLAVVGAAGSLVGRFGRARGVERLQLRWVAFAAVLVALAGVAVLASLAIGVPGATTLFSVALGLCLVLLPLATGAAILRYRLYDLDRIVSRTLAWGCSPSCSVLGTPGSCWASAGCCRRAPAWWSPPPPWRSPRRSSPPAAASSRRSTAASTGAATTPPGRSPRSAPACASRSTWTPSPPSCSAWSSRPCSRPACRCGCDRPSVLPRIRAVRAHPVRLGGRRRLPGPFAPLCETGS
jgi:hypothetical protein